jgi:hypothetical protein
VRGLTLFPTFIYHTGQKLIFYLILEPIKIIVDCQIINEDTLVGLELQQLTPFRFHFHKLWINNYIRQIVSSPTSFDISLILNLTNIDVN